MHPDERLPPNSARIWAWQRPVLAPGSYTLEVGQNIAIPNETQSPQQQYLSNPQQHLRVRAPRFSLSDSADLYSVHPAPGHSAPARTLAHVVFRHPTIPWEQQISGDGVPGESQNLQPWLGVVTFTEDELMLTDKAFKDLGFDLQAGDSHTGLGTVQTLESRLASVSSKVLFALPPVAAVGDIGEEKASMLIISQSLYQSLFSGYDQFGRRVWTGNADLSAFAMLSHVLEVNGSSMASAHVTAGHSSSQPKFSVAVSSRTGPPSTPSPKRVISHLISLVGLPQFPTKGSESEFAGLVSLHAWDWMAMPEEAADFTAVMSSLGQNVQPLAASLDTMPDAQDYREESSYSEEYAWLQAKLEAGFFFKPHTTMTGDISQSLMRGPLIPLLPEPSIVKSFSLYGEGLEYADRDTGIPVVSYKAAWSLGRSMIMADRALASSLLRLRGNVHQEVVRRLKRNALEQAGHHMLIQEPRHLFDSLEDVVNHLERSHTISVGRNKRNGAGRWTRSDAETARHPAQILAPKTTSYTTPEYLNELDTVMLDFFGIESRDDNGQVIEARPIDADAAAIRAWALDRLMLAGIPLHYLVMDPDVLPCESIRTFYIDHSWIDSLVDGGLGLANHHARDDDALRRAMKNCINRFLDNPRHDGPNAGVKPQIPRWGFLMRSTAVSGCPDLKISAPLPPGYPNCKEVVYMEKLAPDILICLFDRCPGEQGITKIIIAQPHHQQGYEMGVRLDPHELELCFRGIPVKFGSPAQPPEFRKLPAPAADVYDYETRRIRPDGLMRLFQGYLDTSKSFGKKEQNSLWSSQVATQLWSPNLRLELTVEDNLAPGGTSVAYAQPQFTAGSRPGKTTSAFTETAGTSMSLDRSLPVQVSLPLRPHAPTSPLVARVKLRAKPVSEAQTETLLSVPLPLQQPRVPAACMMLYTPGNTSNKLHALSDLNDVVFSLGNDTFRQIPDQVEVRLPVAFQDPDGGIEHRRGSVLIIDGVPNTAHCPVIEDTSIDHYWAIRGRFAQGCPYGVTDGSAPGTVVSPQLESRPMLILTIRPRFRRLPQLIKTFNVSFILRQVTLNMFMTESLERSTAWPSNHFCIDVIWQDSVDKSSVTTSQGTIEPSVRTAILDVSRPQARAGHVVRLSLSPPPPRNSRLRLRLHSPWQARDVLVDRAITWDDEDQNSWIVTCCADLGSLADTRLTVATMDTTGTLPMGPESEEWFVPQGVVDIDAIIRRQDPKIEVLWSAPSDSRVPSAVTTCIVGPGVYQQTSALGSVGRTELGVVPGQSITQVTVSVSSLSGSYPREMKQTLRHATLPSIPKPLYFSPRLARETSPFNPNSRLPGLTVLPGSRTSATDQWQNELWYFNSPRNANRVSVERYLNDPTQGDVSEGLDTKGQVIPEIPSPFPDSTGTLVPFFVRCESGDSMTKYFMLAWIGVDGSINVSHRTVELDPVMFESAEILGAWTTATIAPPWSASTVNGGCIDVSALGHTVRDVYRPFGATVLWWVGPQGNLCAARCHGRMLDRPVVAPLPRNSPWFSATPSVHREFKLVYPRWSSLWDTRSTDSVDFATRYRVMSELSCPASRSAQLAAIFIPSVSSMVFHFSPEGSLVVTSWNPWASESFKQETIAGGTARTGRTSVAAMCHRGTEVSVAWFSSSGTVYHAHTQVWTTASENPLWPWTTTAITMPGAAHPMTDMCLFGGIEDTAIGIAFIGPDGHFNIVTRHWTKDANKRTTLTGPSWTVLPEMGPLKGSRLRLASVGPNFGRGINDVFFWDDDRKLRQLGIDLSSLSGSELGEAEPMYD